MAHLERRSRNAVLTIVAIACVTFAIAEAISLSLIARSRMHHEEIVPLIDRAGFQRSLMLQINQEILSTLLGRGDSDRLHRLQKQADDEAAKLDQHASGFGRDLLSSHEWEVARNQRSDLRADQREILDAVANDKSSTAKDRAERAARHLQRKTNAYVVAQSQAIFGLTAAIGAERRRAESQADLIRLFSTLLLLAFVLGASTWVVRKLKVYQQQMRAQTVLLEHIALMVRRAQVMFVLTDKEGRVTYVNEPFEKVSGYTHGELLGKKPGQVLQCAQTNVKAQSTVASALREGRPVTATLLNQSKAGRLYWVRLHIEPIYDHGGGQLIGFASLQQDVTVERSRRQELINLLEAIPAGVLVVDTCGLVIELNQQVVKVFGLSVGDDLSHNRWVGQGQFFSSDGYPLAPEHWPINKALREGVEEPERELVFRKQDGLVRHFKIGVHFSTLPDIPIQRIIITFTDVSAFHKDMTILRIASEVDGIGAWECHVVPQLLVVSSLWWQRLGRNDGRPTHSLKDLLRTIVPEDRRSFIDLARQILSRSCSAGAVEVRLSASTGVARWVRITASVVAVDSSGRVLHIVGLHQDVTERKVTEQELYLEQTTDRLTNLNNRRSFLGHLERHIQGVSLPQSMRPYAVLIIDLDNLQSVNDRFGHGAGDIVLKEVATRLMSHQRGGSLVAGRLGDDEFGLLVCSLGVYGDSDLVAKKILDSLLEPIKIDKEIVEVSCCIGISTPLESSHDARALLRDADIALHAAKSAGIANVRRFVCTMRDRNRGSYALSSDVRRGLMVGEFVNHYQPIIDACSGAAVGFEALVRWNHPIEGLKYPNYFIDIAESAGLINVLGIKVLNSACVDFSYLRACVGASAPGTVSVNISRAQLTPDLPAQIAGILNCHGLPPKCLQLEVTESLAMVNNESIAILRELHAMGAQIALDDFGTGYSSLSVLDTFPITSIKIDKSFVSSLETNAYRQAVVSAAVRVAKALGLVVVAEGVETVSQRILLAEMGCERLQGYLFSKPVNLEGFVQYIKGTHS